MIKTSQIKIALNLGLVAAVCALLISLIMSLTKHNIEVNRLQNKQSVIIEMMQHQAFETRVLPVSSGFESYLQENQEYYISDNSQLIVLPWKAPNAYQDEIDFFIAVNSSAVIENVRVISHQETPGLGDKIELSKSDWILSFNGKQKTREQDFQVKKYGGQFDSFSGATITPQAMVESVYQALVYIEANQSSLFNTSALTPSH